MERPRRTNNWGLRARPVTRRRPRRRVGAAAAERHARWAALGTLIAGIAGALGLLVSAVVAYQGVMAWQDQTQQGRDEREGAARKQASQVGWWAEQGRYVLANRSLDPIRLARVEVWVNWRGRDVGSDRDVLDVSDLVTIHLGVVPPCTRLSFAEEDTRKHTTPPGPLFAPSGSATSRAFFSDAATSLWEIGPLGGLQPDTDPELTTKLKENFLNEPLQVIVPLRTDPIDKCGES